ncbi:hypothetical protein VPNG_08092 [Cytospora leucostoma]|uniref:Stc1 domain-containing protein n=1 Tax=Cytospora leucostoma TaxID=1230097 RepID=A0A423WSD5_9PEZI|nr:hypothetical protein VPNG_08092 [Cytospora leucostoma]
MSSVSRLPEVSEGSARKPVSKVRKVKKYCENCEARRQGNGYKVHHCMDCQYFGPETGPSNTVGKKRKLSPSKAAKIFCEECTKRKNEKGDEGRTRKNAKHKCEACRRLRAEATRGEDEEVSGDDSDVTESQEPVLKRRRPESVAASSSGTPASETAAGSAASPDHGLIYQDRDDHGAAPKSPWFYGTEPGVRLPELSSPIDKSPTRLGPEYKPWVTEDHGWSSPPGYSEDLLEPSGSDSTWSLRSSQYDAWYPDPFEDEEGWILGPEEDEAS